MNISSVSDPHQETNVDLDPGTKKYRDKLAYKSTKIIKIYFFLEKSLILFNIRE